MVGIYIQGEDSEPEILRNRIEGTSGPALKILYGSEARIKGNEFINNEVGIESVSGDPFIFMNVI